MNSIDQINCKVHSLRTSLYEELHARPFQLVSTPCDISHLAFRLPKKNHDEVLSLICELCEEHGLAPPEVKASDVRIELHDFSLQWESHVEFYSITITRHGQQNKLFSRPAIDALDKDFLSRCTGEIVAAFHLAVTNDDTLVEGEPLKMSFGGAPVAVSETMQRNARFYTAFRLHKDGFGRFIILNQGMNDEQMGRLARRLIDMETYRLFAMLAFPLAKQIAPQLIDMDKQLASLLGSLSNIDFAAEERDLLSQISQMESRLETWRSETNRSFSGARAYHEMIQNRLERIAENKVTGNATLSEFMCRRLDPALRTCAAVHSSMEDLSQRIKTASELLRTRISLNQQEQNRLLLTAMNRRSRLQFRLQETVEGLSVVAISYYLVGLFKYLFEGLPLRSLGLDKGLLVSVSIPVVIVFVILLTRKIKARIIKEPCD